MPILCMLQVGCTTGKSIHLVPSALVPATLLQTPRHRKGKSC